MKKLIVKLSQFGGTHKKNVAGKIKLKKNMHNGPSNYLPNSLRIRKSMWTRFLNSFIWICQTPHVS